MSAVSAEERALSRAAVYRLLAAAFAYPSGDSLQALLGAAAVARRAVEIMEPAVGAALSEVESHLSRMDQASLEETYQRTFTLSYNEDCPLYETAFSARHIFQQTQQQADIAGFYRAFGVDPHMERPDHLAPELEFLYLLALKEAWARAEREAEHIAVCREAQRAFLRDHLSRWARQAAGRTALAGRGTFYEAAARLLLAFLEGEERFLRLGAVPRFSEEPILIADEPGEFSCPLVDMPAPVDIRLLERSSR